VQPYELLMCPVPNLYQNCRRKGLLARNFSAVIPLYGIYWAKRKTLKSLRLQGFMVAGAGFDDTPQKQAFAGTPETDSSKFTHPHSIKKQAPQRVPASFMAGCGD
jgi:hypothetical protein